MEVSELDIGLAHLPVGLDHAERFAGQGLADKDHHAGAFDLAVAAHLGKTSVFCCSDRPRRFSGPLVLQAQHRDKGEGQCRKGCRHQDQRSEMVVEQVLIEQRADII